MTWLVILIVVVLALMIAGLVKLSSFLTPREPDPFSLESKKRRVDDDEPWVPKTPGLDIASGRELILRTMQNTYQTLFANPEEAIIFDTETTGLTESDEIIEIAIIDLRGEVLFNQRIKPTRKSWKSAEEIHGISPEMLKDCPTWPEVYPTITRIFEGKDVLGWNVEFDIQMLRNTTEKHDLPWMFHFDFKNTACVMTHYGAWVGERYPNSGHYKKYKLTDAVRACGGTISDEHSALGDCLMTLEVAKRMAGL